MNRLFAQTWLLCGVLDGLYATVLAGMSGGNGADVYLQRFDNAGFCHSTADARK